MLAETDAAFQNCRLVKQGRLSIDPALDEFVALATARLGFAPLWLETDQLSRPRTARLFVWHELSTQVPPGVGPKSGGPKLSVLRRTAAEIAVATTSADLWRSLFGVDKPPGGTSPTDAVWVNFTSFEEAALRVVHAAVSQEETRTFESTLGLGDAFWRTNRLWAEPIVFVHTEEQAIALRSSGRPQEWADSYLAIAKPHDEFGYLRSDEVKISVDSKERFDTHCASSWFYYWRSAPPLP